MQSKKTTSEQKRLDMFYIGSEYRDRSKWFMGELYEITDREHRLAWDLLGDYVAKGYAISVRPATTEELAWAERETVKHEQFWKSVRERQDKAWEGFGTWKGK